MGIITSIFSQTFPPQSKFNVEDIPDLTGKVIIVTGGNAGMFALSVKVNTDGEYKYRDRKRNDKGKSSSMPTSP
jgi:hypothetical protein